MRLYLAAMRLSFRRHRRYTAATVSGLVTNSFFGLVISATYIALYRQRPEAEGYRLLDMLTYTWIGQGLIMPLNLWGWQEIALTIRSGDIASDLAKPFNYFGYWLSRDLGRAAYHFLSRWIPTVAVGWLFFRVTLPANPLTWLAFGVSLTLAVVISFCIRFLINLTAFWLLDIRGTLNLSTLFVNFFSGFLLPLAFFPPGLRVAAEILPFAGMVNLPLQVFLERAQGLTLLGVLLQQAAWVVACVVACQALLGAATRKLVVQGG